MRTLRQDASRPSRTARAIAAGRAIGYRHLHDPDALVFLPPAERVVVRRARSVAARRLGADTIAIATAGLSRHAALRMNSIDVAVLDAVERGCHQIVVVGAGFDTRAWRLPELAGRRVWELDLPGTQGAKRRGLGDRAHADHVQFVGTDLAQTSIPEALASTDHDPTVRTAWVWEAVAPYLTPDAVVHTLEGLRARSADGSRLVMTFANPNDMGPRALAPVTGPLAAIGFHAIGEPILSTYDQWEVSAVLSEHGFTDTVITDATMWARQAGVSARPDPLRAEMLATATAA